ncbi:hypothetical protein ABW21_db0201335 [Orbilia brochopaga]|nr:hypothetical protein ABW21_db0201335 [Drechslerella brochopaga]
MAGIQIISDLHLHLGDGELYEIFEPDPAAPYLALLGNIGRLKDEGFWDFLRRMMNHYKIVFFVPGNIEPYGTSWLYTLETLNKFAADTDREAELEPESGRGKFVLMDQRRYDIDDSNTLLGCTLFSAIKPEHQEDVKGDPDFLNIRGWTVDKHMRSHAEDVTWLNWEVQNLVDHEPHRRVVILTHYCPDFRQTKLGYELEDPKGKLPDATDMTEEESWTAPNVVGWAWGHAGNNCSKDDFRAEEKGQNFKRLVSNQRLYNLCQVKRFKNRVTLEMKEQAPTEQRAVRPTGPSRLVKPGIVHVPKEVEGPVPPPFTSYESIWILDPGVELGVNYIWL